jgi:two-component sensor histidine kinase
MKRSLLGPFLCIIAFGLAAQWLTERSVSRAVVIGGADRLLLETAARAGDRTAAYLGQALELATINAAMASSAHIVPPSLEMFRLTLWREMLGRNDLDIAAIGFANGDYVEAQRLGDGRVRTGTANAQTGGDLVLRAADGQGRPLAEEFRNKGYDPRLRPWYGSAAASGKPGWAEPYAIVSTLQPVMSAVVPFFDPEGNLAGVTAVDIGLARLASFLGDAESVQGGLALILDGHGNVLASSAGVDGPGTSARGGKALETPASAVLARMRADPGHVIAFQVGSRRCRAVAIALDEKLALSWSLAFVYPEDAFLAGLAAADEASLVVLLAALALTVAFAFSAAHRVSRPLQRLGSAVSSLDLDPGAQSLPGVEELMAREDEIGRLAISFDTQAKRLAESFASLTASIGEKEILLRELNHRVKNNLQIVSSLISAQAHRSGDPGTAEGLERLQERIQAMAYVHEDIVYSGNLEAVDMDRYLARVSDSLAISSSIAEPGRPSSSCAVTIEVLQGRVSLPADRALPCGLIVNELVANSYKHAFEGRGEGRIRVSLTEAPTAGLPEDSILSLVVEDDGVGFAAGSQAETPASEDPGTKGLGRLLVGALADQLGGKPSTESGAAGTRYTITFPRRRP